MLPIFPIFKSLEIDDRQEVSCFTHPFPPYSDFNFASLWAWNIHNNTELSLLNDNLIIKFRDYSINEYFYSFMGTNRVPESIEILLEYSQKMGFKEQLKLLPESNFSKYNVNVLKHSFLIVEDRNNHDYILSIEKIASMKGKKLHQKRRLLNRFLKRYNHEVVIHKIEEKGVESKVLDFSQQWKKTKEENDFNNDYDLKAIQRLFINPSALNLNVIFTYSENFLIGFSIFEILDDGYAVSDFQKANLEYDGASEFINYSLAQYLKEQGCIYLNIEQDMGISGLRRAKLDYDPTYLKKYIISKKK